MVRKFQNTAPGTSHEVLALHPAVLKAFFNPYLPQSGRN